MKIELLSFANAFDYSYETGFLVKPPRDFAQRKVYSVIRISLAIIRLNKATTEIERDKAGQWLWAWVSFSGTRYVKSKRNIK